MTIRTRDVETVVAPVAPAIPSLVARCLEISARYSFYSVWFESLRLPRSSGYFAKLGIVTHACALEIARHAARRNATIEFTEVPVLGLDLVGMREPFVSAVDLEFGLAGLMKECILAARNAGDFDSERLLLDLTPRSVRRTAELRTMSRLADRSSAELERYAATHVW